MNIKTEYNNHKITLFHTETTYSTNDDAKSMGKDGALCVADRQTGGRGRMGRSFVSGNGGVYMSLFLDTKKYEHDVLFITAAAAVAASYAADLLCGEKTSIKWVNDIYLCGKKVCGILAEGIIESGKITSVVLGIGVNLVKTFDFEGELRKKAGFIFEKADFETKRKEFIELFLEKFYELYENRDMEKIVNAYREKDYLKGKKVTFVSSGREYSGIAEGIDENIALAVKCEGKTFLLTFGEVNIKI